MTPDQVWKAPVTAAEEFDRTWALRMAAAAAGRAIATDSLEAYWRQWDDPSIAEDVGNAPAALVDEFGWIMHGEGHLRLSDGSRWVHVSALMDDDFHGIGPGDNLFLQRLYALLVEHQVGSEHSGPSLPAVLLNAETLDAGRVFCTEAECRRWVDLRAEAEDVDRTHEPWEEEGDEAPET